MCLLSSEQPAWSWCFQTFRGCEEIEPWPEDFYQPLCLNSELRKDQSPCLGSISSFDICEDCQLGDYDRKVFLFGLYIVLTARKEIGKCYYFSLSQADVLWVCSAGGKVSEIPSFALHRAKS